MKKIPDWIDTPLPLVPEINYLSDWVAFNDMHSSVKKKLSTRIHFHSKKAQKSDIAILYIHGYGSSINETAPLTKIVSKKLNANTVFQRIARHGIKNSPMSYLDSYMWYYSALQGLAISQKIGKKIIVISCSTGSTLSLLLSARKTSTQEMNYQILLSPNCHPNPVFTTSLFFTPMNNLMEAIPLIPIIGPLATPTNINYPSLLHKLKQTRGKFMQYEYNDQWLEYNSNIRTPTSSITSMMQLIRYIWAIKNLDAQRYKIPCGIISSTQDKEVSYTKTKKFFSKLSSQHLIPHKIVEFEKSQHYKKHILAGDLFSSETTIEISEIIIDLIQSHINNTGDKK